MVGAELNATFWVRDPDGHDYKVHRDEGRGGAGRWAYLRTDGWDRVHALGNGWYEIPALGVVARSVAGEPAGPG